jgi:hypothetical protein
MEVHVPTGSSSSTSRSTVAGLNTLAGMMAMAISSSDRPR